MSLLEGVRWTSPPVWGTILFALQVIVAARAITRPDRTPASRAAWVACILWLPIFGLIAYFFLGETYMGRDRAERLRDALKDLKLPDDGRSAPSASKDLDRPLLTLCQSINGFRAVTGNRIDLLAAEDSSPDRPSADSDAAIDTLIEDIGRARLHIHISFYIWLDDHHGGKVVDAVCVAAGRGVACRVMVDALGSRDFVRSGRWHQLRAAGVHVVATLDDIPRIGHLAVGRIDLRNHRKIVVIDNRIGYCGSQNCADPEFRVQRRFAPWIDMLLRCEGPVVRQAQYLFLSAWIAETGERQLEDMPFEPVEDDTTAIGVVAQMFGTGPNTAGNAMSDMFVATIDEAREELLITTPYFAPDEALFRALCAAPRRGVAATVIFPAKNNSWLVGKTCRSAYADLLASGVSVYEYPLGLLHSKSITVDGRLTLVGSANMDRRSLELNFENNLLVCDAAVTASVRHRQLAYLSRSRAIPASEVAGWSLGQRLVQNAIAMMAPIL